MFRRKKQPQVRLEVGKDSFLIALAHGTKIGKEIQITLDVEIAAELARQINKGIFGMSRYSKK